jgi:hypothetical protein
MKRSIRPFLTSAWATILVTPIAAAAINGEGLPRQTLEAKALKHPLTVNRDPLILGDQVTGNPFTQDHRGAYRLTP